MTLHEIIVGNDALLVHEAHRLGVLPGAHALTPSLHHADLCPAVRRPAGPCSCACELRVGERVVRYTDLAATSIGEAL